MFAHIWTLTWKEAFQFWRDKLILIFVLIFPVWNLVSVADMVSRGIIHIPTAMVDEDRRFVAPLAGKGPAGGGGPVGSHRIDA